jgi:small subunit ribosomal protein S9
MPEKEITDEIKKTAKEPSEPTKPFRGKYISAIGRRKTSVAQVRLYKKGSGVFIVNGKKISEVFPSQAAAVIKQPVKLTENMKDIDLSIIVSGGGINGQAEAIRHGITRCLVEMDEEVKPSLKAKGWVTRDSRRKERKKPGLKKARKAPQWSKR